MTPAAALSIAKQFHKAHELCFGNGLTTVDGQASADVPSVVNLLFAIELALKAALLAHGTKKRTHELHELYSLLPAPDQQAISHHAGVEPKSFRENLEAIAGAFQTWRYAHENTGMLSISPVFLEMAWIGALALAEKRRSEQIQALRHAQR